LTASPATFKAPVPFQVMTKPNGPRCNLDCTYCYYLEKDRLYPDTKKFRMSDEVLEVFVRDYIASQRRAGAPEIWFSWQGGEPTMLGVGFFETVVELQKKYCPDGGVIRNALQTNGTLIDDEWAAFFKKNEFLIGLSIDGPKDLHDHYRVDRRELPTFDKVMAGLETLKRHEVEFNALVVVNRQNSRRPRDVYRFLKENGVEFMQFIPLVERSADGETLAGAPQQDDEGIKAKVTPWSVLPKAYGDFLVSIFDEWIKADVGKIFVQFFDVQLGLWMGGPAGLCWFAETCGQGLAMEHNGDLYACDHYVYPEYLLGNITETPMDELVSSPAQTQFGQDKRDSLPKKCVECRFKFACNGGCPKHRFLDTPDKEPGLNYFCASYMRFFKHAAPYLRTMADLAHRGQPPAGVMEIVRQHKERASGATKPKAKPGRNTPCPCGSGRKFKACCGRVKA